MSVDSGHMRGLTIRSLEPADFIAVREHILRVTREDLGYDYRPEWHWDLDDLQGVYVDHPRQALFLAVDDGTGDLVGTTSVVNVGPNAPPHPIWLAERYNGPTIAQLLRVYVARSHRRRGVAHGLVESARRFVAQAGGYETIYLHTNASVPGAEAFWRAMPTTLVCDGRGNTDGFSEAVHFELAFPSDGVA
jgi:GNAT superfamily N-acetyltransferase